jgi:hypothetical protein
MTMTTVISIVKRDGSIEHDMAFYLMGPADAVRNYYYQFYQKNYNTWEYKKPDDIGVKPTPRGAAMLVVENGDTIYGKKEDV